MTSTNHEQNHGLQPDARAWADFTGTNYTAALRQMTSPLAQGLLVDRVSAQRLTGKIAAVVADVAGRASA